MHEMSLCKSMLEIVKHEAENKKFKCVKKIYLEFGKLIALERSAFTFAFDVLKRGTIVENAVLEYIELPGKMFCQKCHEIFVVNQYGDPCDICGTFSSSIVQGEELRVKSMEVE